VVKKPDRSPEPLRFEPNKNTKIFKVQDGSKMRGGFYEGK
jgi:hypothetical protein